jgi:hypothetical protein
MTRVRLPPFETTALLQSSRNASSRLHERADKCTHTHHSAVQTVPCDSCFANVVVDGVLCSTKGTQVIDEVSNQ